MGTTCSCNFRKCRSGLVKPQIAFSRSFKVYNILPILKKCPSPFGPKIRQDGLRVDFLKFLLDISYGKKFMLLQASSPDNEINLTLFCASEIGKLWILPRQLYVFLVCSVSQLKSTIFPRSNIVVSAMKGNRLT